MGAVIACVAFEGWVDGVIGLANYSVNVHGLIRGKIRPTILVTENANSRRLNRPSGIDMGVILDPIQAARVTRPLMKAVFIGGIYGGSVRVEDSPFIIVMKE